jgi:hypothetical protein
VTKLGPDGVRLQVTDLGNVAIVIPRVYLDEPAPASGSLALVLGRADARELSRMLELTARTGIAPLTGRLPDLDERAGPARSWCRDTSQHSAHEWAGGTLWCEGVPPT